MSFSETIKVIDPMGTEIKITYKKKGEPKVIVSGVRVVHLLKKKLVYD